MSALSQRDQFPMQTTFSSPSHRTAHCGTLRHLILCGLMCFVFAPTAMAQNGLPDALPEDGPAYPVSEFVIQYVQENPDHPPVETVMNIRVELGLTNTGFVAPRADTPTEVIQLAGVSDRPLESYHGTAIQLILESIRSHLGQMHMIGVFVAPDPDEINEVGEDIRPGGHTTLRIFISTGIITELRTLASGERIPPEERVNNPLHDRIREQSPIQPFEEGDEARSDLTRRDVLDRYLFHLSRHPGRRVDSALSAAEDPGGIALDYLVTENRPLVLYAQIANTGTSSTDRLRERFGFFHTQLTNNDDIVSVDYSTANFDQTHAIVASYERPFPNNDRWRWRIDGGWSEFTASDVGFFMDTFTGESWSVGGSIIVNVYQENELFVDVVGGVRFQNHQVSNPFVGTGEEDFIIPFIGGRLDRTTEWFSTLATLNFEWHSEGLGDVDLAQMTRLGRSLPDEDWVVMKWSVAHSVYLEPLFNRAEWEDPTTPESSTLAHELALSFRGQHAFDNRLIPQEEHVLGGLYTVRGYPESIVAGDTVFIGSVEYRFHVPRAFDIEPEPRELFGEPFRRAPQYVYGHPDWDLILKAFFDAGRAEISNPLSFESDQSLIGAGVGVELLYRRNVNVRVDWGFALDDLAVGNVHSGSNRVHFVATLLF